ncbi:MULTISPECIES: geranylgeranylglycerol-phosphate geranylgeranyltransferase [unclassified Flavobacterium]|uniref:geranylgeranylglycerol-phosphate geranylgeranyltransferase n=1 Tax=unclassified Flavobacterium TaxID=196869 RepID=UPI001F13C00D|nr:MULTISPECIES: geranylgeranylglycerol-phosphate geranylgeranyltransferase [unclassified Flavobacterium]UMY65985.1 geranylgeranylglycerol-phosphate geranylgeranyltransferase [Flavobacterium sp. HJ-32-4]
MLSRKHKLLLMKIVSLFSVVRGYNIPIIALAQYLSAIFIFAHERRALHILLDGKLFVLVLSTTLTIASGYIINNFYDSRKDLINRPHKSMLDRLVSQRTKLHVYFSLNLLSCVLASMVSWRAIVFFSFYIFLIWFYSHKIKRFPLIGNLMAAFLAILPFFAILMYYKNFYHVIFIHAVFLFLLLLIREMVKDLENLTGDLANGYETIPVRFGEAMSKRIITLLVLLTVLPVYALTDVYDVGYMDLYLYCALTTLVIFLLVLWRATSKRQFNLLHNLLKGLIVAGVFSIVLIDPSTVLHAREMLD